MRMLSRVLAFGGVAVTLALCAFVDPSRVGPVGALNPAQLGGGSTGLQLSASMQYDGYEGGEPKVIASSHGLAFDHLMSGSYRYVPASYALHVGQDTIAWTKFDYFDGAGSSHYAAVPVTTFGLYDGDSLYVSVTIATESDSSAVIDSKTVGYLIDHDIEVLAMGNPYGGVDIFNPTGLAITDSVEVDATTFKTAWMRNSGGAWDDTCYVSNGKQVEIVTGNPIYGADYSNLRIPLLWWDFESYLPDNITITEAYISLRSYETDLAIAFNGANDGFFAVLDTLSGDVPWTEGSVGHCNAGKDPLQTSAQISFMSRANQTAWDPPVELRPATYWWGIQSAKCRTFGTGDNTLNANQDIKIDVKDVLQYWVDFHDVRDIQQAGWFIMAQRAAGTSSAVFQCGTNGTYEEYSPSLIVRYQNKQFDDYPYNGKPFVFAFTSDDGHKDALKYAHVMEGRGKKMTLFAVRDLPTDFSEVTYMTDAEYLAFYSAGHEVGVQANDNRTMTSMADSLDFYVSREHWAGILGLTGADTMQIASFAYNLGDTTTAGIAKLKEYGYIGSRLAYDARLVDTIDGGTLPWSGPANVMKVNKWMWNHIADHDDTADSVRVKTRIQFGMSSARGTPVNPRPIITLSHAGSGSSYNGGVGEMDTLGLGLYIDELIRRGDTDITTFGDILRIYRAKHVPDTEGGIIWRLP